jgi:hypothetical protein
MTHLVERAMFPQPIDLEAVERDWATGNIGALVLNDPAGQVWRDFVHATNEVVTIAEDPLKVTVEGEFFMADIGDEAFIPKDGTHTVANAAASRNV